MKEMDKGTSCIEGRHKGFNNPIETLTRWKNNIKYAYQRAHYGYCDRDIWNIDYWFLKVMPAMLEQFKETTHGYPDMEGAISHAVYDSGRDLVKDDAGMKAWKDVLDEMIFLLREADEDTCTRENPYDEEWRQAWDEFECKYGLFGEKLLTEEDLAGPGRRAYLPAHLDEYKDISDKHTKENIEILKYRSECKHKALELFDKWFWNLWD
ncbi:MAG: hypothetical protein E7275_12150 [Pseudobutyrivibrio sp.]|uniref:hypothetical protein n=1 Tax=Pseudobutyrivibrio sp. TaxID=2014367 RepID=UPI0025D8EC67|nr:hypothetical protein [Pseudobutyrivibrio sp.]MBE5905017.1 hypothetical protein [Pseudobutyrivibrio sp.]